MQTSLSNQCPECAGTLVQKTITHDLRFEGRLYSFHDVPARVCAACGAAYLDAPVLKQIEATFKRRREPEQYLKVPAFSFDRLSA